MNIDFIRKFKEECISQDNFWVLNKKLFVVIGAFVFALITVSSILNYVQLQDKDATAYEELSKEAINTENDGINAAIASDDTNQSTTSAAMVAMSIEETGRSDPFLPDGEKVVIRPKIKYSSDLLPPPETIIIDNTATDVVVTKVSGIMYDKYNPSAILNIKGSDYLVRSGDVINGYKVLAIAKDNVTVQNGANVYKAGVGEIISGGSINYNNVPNLEGKFGGRNNVANKK